MTMAKVAHVLSDHEVVFNAGSEQGIEAGDIATLYREIEVLDPDTQEPLGKVRRPLITFRIDEVEDKLCVGATYERERGSGNLVSFGIILSGPSRWRVTSDRSKVDSSTVLVKVGQLANIRHPKKRQSEKKP